MASNEAFDIDGPVGRLEAILMLPDTAPQAAALVCHAHPLQGGIMHFKVLFRAAKAFQAHGLAVLRFNFRGVGRSGGEHDHGRGEQDDVRAAMGALTRRFPGLPLVLGGFSFGSWMALQVGVQDERARALFALGFPVRMLAGVEFLDGCTKPRLFVQGDADQFGVADEIRALVGRLPEPKSLAVVPNSDHFFTDRLDALQQAIEAWAGTAPWRPA